MVTFRILLIHFRHSIYNFLRTDIKSTIDFILTFNLLLTPYCHPAWRNKTYNAQNWQGSVHKTAQMKPTAICQVVTNISTWYFLKKIAQSYYGGGCELENPKFRIPARANVFFLLQNGSEAHTAPWLVCTSLLPRGKCGQDVSLTTHLYQVPKLHSTKFPLVLRSQ